MKRTAKLTCVGAQETVTVYYVIIKNSPGIS